MWLDDFLKSVLRTEATVDASIWKPFPEYALVPYYFAYLTESVFKTAKICQKKQINKKILAQECKNQAWYRGELDSFTYYLDLIQLKKGEKKFLLKFFLDLLSLNTPDPFALKGITRLYNEKELQQVISSLNWQMADLGQAKNLGFLTISLFTLTYALYTDLFPQAGSVFHGPYPIGSNFVLIIRDFFDIKPVQLWPESKNFKYRSVTIFTIYSRADFFIDCYGNISCSANLPQILLKYAVLVDGKEISSPKKILPLADYFSRLTCRYYQKFEKFNFEETKKKFEEVLKI